MSPILYALHHHPFRICLVTIAIVLPLAWMLAPSNGLLP